jgi:CysZ protein
VNQPQVQTAAPASARRGGFIGDFFLGVGCLLRGLGTYGRSPRLMLLGLIPAFLSFVVLAGAFVAMIFFVDDVARFMTPWAEGWSGGIRDTLRFVVTVAVAAVWMILSVLVFTALTLLIGQPFYEAISKRVEDSLGGVADEIDVSFWRSLPRTVGESLRLLLLTAISGIAIFAIGLIPVAGQIIAPILAATLGGWVLALELTSVPFERRGKRFRERRALLRSRRTMALGFGMATFICFLIPLGAVLVMPAAVAGATVMSRRLFGLPVEVHG